MSKPKYSSELKIRIAKAYLKGEGSYKSLSDTYGVGRTSVKDWVRRLSTQGESVFFKGEGNAKYASEFKKQCVEAVLSGEGAVDEVTAKYNISSRSVLQGWIIKYNTHRELKDYCPEREVYMAEARRKTTLEERKEIVEYCITHHRNYKEAAHLYEVSYSQVYSWTKKYEEKGAEGLTDKRGHHKTDDEVDELERLRRENARLKKQLNEKDMLAELLKKVHEFERM